MKLLHQLDSPQIPRSAHSIKGAVNQTKVDFDLSESPAPNPETSKDPDSIQGKAQPAAKDKEKPARSSAERGFGDTFYASPRPTIYIPVSPSTPSKRRCHNQDAKEGRQSASWLVRYYFEKRRVRPTIQRESHLRMAPSSPPYAAYII